MAGDRAAIAGLGLTTVRAPATRVTTATAACGDTGADGGRVPGISPATTLEVEVRPLQDEARSREAQACPTPRGHESRDVPTLGEAACPATGRAEWSGRVRS
ncbi:MAG: hypothetical protein KAS77_04345 [Thermoplasmata archaeon]|nr:hypothetical protein [Thermoplasmata archaeon]